MSILRMWGEAQDIQGLVQTHETTSQPLQQEEAWKSIATDQLQNIGGLKYCHALLLRLARQPARTDVTAGGVTDTLSAAQGHHACDDVTLRRGRVEAAGLAALRRPARPIAGRGDAADELARVQQLWVAAVPGKRAVTAEVVQQRLQLLITGVGGVAVQ